MKKKVLYILPSLPYPLSTGGNQAMFNGIKAVKDDFDIYVTYQVPFYNNVDNDLKQLKKILDGVTFIPFVYNPLKGFHNFILWIFFRIKILLKMKKKNPDYYCSQMPQLFAPPLAEFTRFIDLCIRENEIEVVQMEMCSTLSHVLTLPDNVKKIFVHHELNYIVNDLRIKTMGVTPYRVANQQLAKILELALLNKCDSVITLSNIDKNKLLNECVKVPIHTSFAIVDTVSYPKDFNECCVDLSFVGPAGHSPNYLGLKWFLENCWNDLLEIDSSYTLKIIGNWSEDKRAEFSKKYKNIEFLGFVSSLGNALNNTIMIVPITVGSGIRMKILEAAGLGIPFVSTSIGAEGLPFLNGKECFLADTPEDFIKSIISLKDKSLREKFAINANNLVREKYSIEALRRNRLNIYERVMMGGGDEIN